jgi:hypothetical protein
MTSYERKHVALIEAFNSKKLCLAAIYFKLRRISCCVAITGAIYMDIFFK